ncbi:hypothetical protein GCG54_00015729, partial [Colletotrichum gloeosporioides]
ITIITLQQGIPSKCKLSAYINYIPTLYTYRPSLLLIK